MNISQINQYLPLKMKAEMYYQQVQEVFEQVKLSARQKDLTKQNELGFKLNSLMSSAKDNMQKFADSVMQWYNNGDESMDALRSAQMGAAVAALFFMKTKDTPRLTRFAKTSADLAREIMRREDTPNNAIKFVSAATCLLECTKAEDCLEIAEYADYLCEELQRYFPTNEEVNKVVKAYWIQRNGQKA
ncbi:MAG: hypothetical protein J6M30_05480 [Bacteroidales bacterium]|nr:hypothetical protein [Bacteroidales bacterium]